MGINHSLPEQSLQLPMEPMPYYPDMNVIFKGIPKMMQVADDMHRMTNYIMDLRNMTFGLMVISILGMLLFLLLKYVQGKQIKRRRRRFQNLDSEQSSLSRTIGVAGGGVNSGLFGGINSSRYFTQKHHPHQVDWNSRHVPIDMEKLIESQHSNSTGALLVNNTISNHRQSPLHHQPKNLPCVSSIANHNGMSGSAGSGGTATTVALHDYRNDVVDNDQMTSTPLSLANHIVTSQFPTFNTSTPTTSLAPSSTLTPFVITNGHNNQTDGHGSSNHYHSNGGSSLIKRLEPVKLLVDEVPYADT